MNSLLKAFILNCLAVHLSSSSTQFAIRNKRVADDWKRNNLHGRVEKGYYVEMLIGTPPQFLNILIDTGSSNFAVASQEDLMVTKYYDSGNSTTVVDMNIPDVDIEYTEGFWKGHLVTDLVSIPDAGLTAKVRANMVEITSSREFFIEGSGWQGILGLAYTDLVRPDNPKVYSFMQSVAESGVKDVFSIELCGPNPKTTSDATTGTLILGQFDESLSDQDTYWTRIVREWYYEVVMIGMKVGEVTVDVPCVEYNNDKTIVDSGTTNLHLPSKVFHKVVQLIKAYVTETISDITIDDTFWDGMSVLCWDQSFIPYDFFPVLTIYLPSTELNNTISLQLQPLHYILYYGQDTNLGQEDKVCYKFGISSSENKGTVLGAVFMEQYVVLFDRVNKVVGFTRSNCSKNTGLQHLPGYLNATACAYFDEETGLTPMRVAMYILLGILAICMIPVCLLLCAWYVRKEKTAFVNDTSELLDSRRSSE